MEATLHNIPVAAPDLSGNEERYVVEAIRSSWISSLGPYVLKFEKEFASICGAGTSIAVCNGTVALHLALLALDVHPGDEVLAVSYTHLSGSTSTNTGSAPT